MIRRSIRGYTCVSVCFPLHFSLYDFEGGSFLILSLSHFIAPAKRAGRFHVRIYIHTQVAYIHYKYMYHLYIYSLYSSIRRTHTHTGYLILSVSYPIAI
jgi:hypothetical protein